MKAKVIRKPYRLANLRIGEIVEIIPGMETDAEGIWNVPAGKLVLCKKDNGTYTYSSLLDMEMIDESPSVDWAAFRREAAKDILAGFAGSVMRDDDILEDKTVNDLVKTAVMWADSLIKQLKEEKK